VPTAIISGTGSCVPEKVISNLDLEKMVNTSDEWINTRTGIRERRVLEEGKATSDLAAAAAKKAMESAGVSAADLDLIVLATFTPDMFFPAAACLLQHRLGASKAAAFDVNAACSGFLYALSVATQYIKAGTAGKILVVGADVMSRVVDWQDRNTCILFGDGAGAIILEAGEDEPGRGVIDVQLYTDGSLAKILQIPAGGSKMPATVATVNDRLHYIKMNGSGTFKVAVRSLTESARYILRLHGYTSKDVDLFIPHQANQRIIKAVAEYLSLPMEKVCSVVDKYGNTSASSVPIALDEAVRTGRLKSGNLALLSAFGSGLTWASSLVRW